MAFPIIGRKNLPAAGITEACGNIGKEGRKELQQECAVVSSYKHSAAVIHCTASTGSAAFTSAVINVATGVPVSTYRGGWVAQPGTLGQVAGYWCAAESQSAVVHFWPIQKSRNRQEVKIICSARVSAMTTADGFCYAGIKEKLHVWQISTGHLFAVVESCFQPISVLKLNASNDCLAVGSEDGSVAFWSIKCLVRQPCSRSQSTRSEPLASFASHSAAVTSICYNSRNKCVSVSRDGKCCIYDLESKEVTFRLSFGAELHSVAMDVAQYRLFVGSESGEIHETRMYEKPESSITARISKSGDAQACSSFIGHRQKVTCLAVTLHARTLVSASSDGTLRLWDIGSKLCIRTIDLKESIGSIDLMTMSPDFGEDCVIAHQFQRSLFQTALNQSLVGSAMQPVSNGHHKSFPSTNRTNGTKQKSANWDASVLSELEKYKKINRELYNMLLRKELAPVCDD